MAASLQQIHPASKNILKQNVDNFWMTGHLEAEGNCHIWQGTYSKTTKKRTSRYPKHTFRYLIVDENGEPSRKRADHYVHHVVWFLEHGTIPIKDSMEISHLCHDSRCLNVTHLHREPHQVNKERYRKCVKNNQQLCQGHGPEYPDSIFD